MTVVTAEPQIPIEQIIATELSVTPRQVWAAIKLLYSEGSGAKGRTSQDPRGQATIPRPL